MAASCSLHEVMLMFCVLSTGSNPSCFVFCQLGRILYMIFYSWLMVLVLGVASWIKSSVSMFLYL